MACGEAAEHRPDNCVVVVGGDWVGSVACGDDDGDEACGEGKTRGKQAAEPAEEETGDGDAFGDSSGSADDQVGAEEMQEQRGLQGVQGRGCAEVVAIGKSALEEPDSGGELSGSGTHADESIEKGEEEEQRQEAQGEQPGPVLQPASGPVQGGGRPLDGSGGRVLEGRDDRGGHHAGQAFWVTKASLAAERLGLEWHSGPGSYDFPGRERSGCGVPG